MKKVWKVVFWAVLIFLVFNQRETKAGEFGQGYCSSRRTYRVLSANVGNSYISSVGSVERLKLRPGSEAAKRVEKGIKDLQPDIIILIEAHDEAQVKAMTGKAYSVYGGPYDFICLKNDIVIRKDNGEFDIRHVPMPEDGPYEKFKGNSVGYVDVGLKDEGGRKVRLFYAHFPSPQLKWVVGVGCFLTFGKAEHKAHLSAFRWIEANIIKAVDSGIPCLIAGDLNNDFIRNRDECEYWSGKYIYEQVNKLKLWIFNPPSQPIPLQFLDGSTKHDYEPTYRPVQTIGWKLTIDWVMGKNVVPPFLAPGGPETDLINGRSGFIRTNFVTNPPNWWEDPGIEEISRLTFDHKPLFGNVVFFWREETIPQLGSAIALVMDRSGSMTGEKLAKAKDAAESFFAIRNPADYAALVSFNQSAQTHVPLVRMRPESRNLLIRETRNIQAEGNTNIGAGLTNGFAELCQISDSVDKSALLMSDGMHNTGELWPGVELFEQKGWPVYTVAYGADADLKTLQEIANRTGGIFFPADLFNISQIYHRISANIRNESVLLAQQDLLSQNEELAYKVLIDQDITFATFFADWQGSTIEMRLITPDNQEIREDNFREIAGVDHKKGQTYCFYQVAHPKAGHWQISLFGKEIEKNEEPVNLTISGSSPLSINLFGLEPSYQPSQPINFSIRVTKGFGGQDIDLNSLEIDVKMRKPKPRLITKEGDKIVINPFSFLEKKTKKIKLQKTVRPKDLIFTGTFDDTETEGKYLLQISCQAKRQNGEKISKVIEESIWIGRVKKN